MATVTAMAIAAALPHAAVAQSAAEVAFMRGVLNRVQPPSFADAVEYCGHVFRADDGTIGASRAAPGDAAGCAPRRRAPAGATIVASYHTHADYDRRYDSEVPSIADLQADFADGLDGWIATPGGRMWFVDHVAREARLICDRGCLIADPDYAAGLTAPVAWEYTIDGLRARD